MKTLLRVASTVLGLLIFSTAAHALTERMYICDACTTSQYQFKAKSNAPPNQVSYAYVLDIEFEVVTKWRVFSETESGITFTNAAQISVDSTMTENFDKYTSVLEGGFHFPFPPDPIGMPFDSAYDLVGNPDGLNDLYDWFQGEYSWIGWDLNYFAALVFEMTTRIANTWVYVTIDFPDGTTLKLKTVDWSPGTLSFRFEYYYATDANGDIIPLDPADYTPDEPVSIRVRDYIINNGYIPVNPDGTPFNLWNWGDCYVGIGCSDDGPTPVCIVVKLADAICPP